MLVVDATDDAELDLAFEKLIRQGIGALVVESDPFFLSRRDKIISMSEHHAMPAIYDRPEWVFAGGLMSGIVPIDVELEGAALLALSR